MVRGGNKVVEWQWFPQKDGEVQLGVEFSPEYMAVRREAEAGCPLE